MEEHGGLLVVDHKRVLVEARKLVLEEVHIAGEEVHNQVEEDDSRLVFLELSSQT